MNYDLNDLEEGFLSNAEWDQSGGFTFQVEDPTGKLQFKVSFTGIFYMKFVASHNLIDNEISSFEEISNSPLLQKVYEKNGVHRLLESFGENYERDFFVRSLSHLHHIVLLSDYLDFDLLCEDYNIQKMS